MFLDCTTQDIERLRPKINQLSLDVQQAQIAIIRDLEPRDQAIVIIGSLAQLDAAAQRATKRETTPRFVRSIRAAFTVARKFGTGQVGRQ